MFAILQPPSEKLCLVHILILASMGMAKYTMPKMVTPVHPVRISFSAFKPPGHMGHIHFRSPMKLWETQQEHAWCWWRSLGSLLHRGTKKCRSGKELGYHHIRNVDLLSANLEVCNFQTTPFWGVGLGGIASPCLVKIWFLIWKVLQFAPISAWTCRSWFQRGDFTWKKEVR